MTIAVVTDSTAYFSEQEKETWSFTVVPLTINFGDENFEEGTVYSNQQFFQKIRQSSVFPTSSQPAVGKFIAIYTELLKDYDHIISIHLSGGLSGSVRSAAAAADTVDANRITVIDSLSTAQGLATMVIGACKLIEMGHTAQEVIVRLNQIIEASRIYFVIDTLEYLHKGGRIGGAAALFGNLLQVKPLLTVDKAGQVQVMDKVRTSKKADLRLLEIVSQYINSLNLEDLAVHIVHADNLVKAQQLFTMFSQALPSLNFIIAELGPVVGMHVGPGACGIIITPLV